MSEYRHIANLQGPRGEPGIGTHGAITEETDIGAFREEEHIGHYVIRNSNLIGGPDISGDPLLTLEVMRGASNGVLQRISHGENIWWRYSSSSTEWGAWSQVAHDPSHGVLSEPTNVDEYREHSHVGHYVARADNLLGGPPISGNPLVTFEVLWGISNGVVQRVTTRDELWWRAASSSTEWDHWRRVADADEISGGTGSGIDYDDDGTPYIAEGAGSNPQPASRRLVTEQTLPDLTSQYMRSSTVRRILTSADPDEPLEDGDLLLVYESE